MKDYNYHALFYYRVLGKIQNLRGGEGVSLSDLYPKKKSEPSFGFCWEQRPDFEFQYQREEHLATRYSYVTIGRPGASLQHSSVLLKIDAENENVVIYEAPLRHVFEGESKEAFDELKELLEKFYTVTVEPSNNISVVDVSTNRRGENYNVITVT